MKQQQYAPLKVSEMAITLFAVDKGAFDDVDVKRALACRNRDAPVRQDQGRRSGPRSATRISTPTVPKQLAAVIEEFKKSYA